MSKEPRREEDGRFKPGQSGNPSGRPKANHKVTELARRYTEEAVATLATLMVDEGVSARARIAAANSLLDRAWGRPPQSIELDAGDAPSLLRVEFVKSKED